jgi:FixJ family two-component response regulator
VSTAGTVYVVDDEPDLRQALKRLFQVEGLQVECYASASDFLAALSDDAAGCVVLDLAMPGLDGLELQQRLARTPAALPIVFLTGRGDIPATVQAMKAGAVDFLTKPVKRVDLLRAVGVALARCAERVSAASAMAGHRERFGRLTPREREVFEHVISGRLNKVIASRLGTTEQTIKVHRGRVMEKLGADSVADLIRLAQQLGVTPAD